ncbi:hypothetical protein SAMN05216359_11673 [Roseateles sp. YR242]|nr:hypothetical protein SAMN05216359_11673 [Roseateles sp. YR242]
MLILLLAALFAGGGVWRAWVSWRRLLRMLPRHNRDLVLF